MATIQELQQLAVKFRDERDWKQFHNFKDMLLSLGLEISEFGEHFQWKSDEEVRADDKIPMGEELSDILYWLFLFAEELEVDLEGAFQQKMKKNEEKYPVEVAKGKKEKYNSLPGSSQ